MGLDGIGSELRAAIPEGGYIREYVEFGWETTMSPPEFHLAAGLAQMAVLMGNRVLIEGPGGRLYPTHAWFVLVGDAGASRKTSGMTLATDLLSQVLSEPAALPADATREALWAALMEQPTGYIMWSEFAGFLAKTQREYMGGIKEDLCDFWDSPPVVRRKLMKDEYVVTRPSVSILAGGVSDRLVELVKEQDLFGGFFSRFMFVEQVTPVPYRGLVWHGKQRERLTDHLRFLANHHGIPRGHFPCRTVGLDDEERLFWEDYDKALWDDPAAKDPLMSGFLARSGVQVLKLAFCYALGRGSLQPEVEDLHHAMALVDITRQNAQSFIADARANATQEGRDLRKIRAAMRVLSHGNEEGWVDQSELLRRTRMRSRNLNEYLETMHESGELQREGRKVRVVA